jgi:hypothetical protein
MGLGLEFFCTTMLDEKPFDLGYAITDPTMPVGSFNSAPPPMPGHLRHKCMTLAGDVSMPS